MLGLETSRILAEQGATVVMAFRSRERSKKAVKSVQKIAEANDGMVKEIVLDLADLSSVKNAAETFKEMNLPLHCLINNAGVMMCPFGTTNDGFERQFGTNHLGHFALTALLFPIIRDTAETEGSARIVNLTSSYHSKGPREGILFDNLLWSEDKTPKYSPGLAYGHSKFANVVFTQELSSRLGTNSKIFVNAVHPGFVDTELTRHMEKKYSKLVVQFFKWYNGALSPYNGALTQVYTAISPEIEEKNYRGQYFVPIAKHRNLDPNAPEITEEMRTKLWEISEQMTGVKFDV